MAIDTVTVSASAAQAAPPAPVPAFNDSDGPSFSDVLDILNPLQHIPIINTIYQHLTGDTEGAVADVAGGTLWAGPIGLVASLIDLDMRSNGGKSASDGILAWLGLEDDDSATATAENTANQNIPAGAQAQAAQQTVVAAAAPALLPAPSAPQRSKSKDTESDAKDDDKDGPRKMGDYLVFGAAGSGQPMALTPPPAAKPVAISAAAPQKMGDYLVFGGGSAPQAAPSAAPPVTVASAAAPAPAPIAPQPAPPPAGLSPLPPRSFAVPARRNQTIPSALPPPTTGPAAIPGHGPSQAIHNTSDADWLLGAIGANLDKYQAAQKLTQSDSAITSDNATLH